MPGWVSCWTWEGHTCTVGFWPARTGDPVIGRDKGNTGIWSWWIPFPKHVARPENPAAWLFLFTGFHVCSSLPWECAAGLSVSFREACWWNWRWFASSKICRLEPAFPRGLLCLLSVILCLYPRCHLQRSAGQETCLATGSHWFCPSGYSPANAAVTPNAAETTVSLWFPLDTATSNLGSQAVEVTETVPAGAWLLPWVNHLVGLGPKGW